jgi:asparagine synthase (glutamine-hydrolysing)
VESKEAAVCGIAGIYHRDGRSVDPAVLDRMTDALAHRGPDGRGVWSEPGVGLGHRRLAIRDLSANGAQPFHSACGRIVVTYNGEIYNDRALARELERTHGFVRRTTCDTEILPAGWLAWGLDLFKRLEGIYALALWDREHRQLVVARDAIGVKPLYFADDGVTVRFGSEVKAFLADRGLSPRIGAQNVASLFALGYVDPQRSLLSEVGQLAPGTVRVFHADRASEHRFWVPERRARIHALPEARDAFVAQFRNVVSDQLVADVPVGVMQSGGIDSSLVSLALPPDADVRLFNVRFQDRAFDESRRVAELAKAAGRPVEFLDLETGEAEADFRGVVTAVDGALADSSALATFRLSRRIRQAATVALSGDGSDEFFGGYPTYRATALSKYLRPALSRPMWSRLGETLATRGGLASGRLGGLETPARLFLGLSLDVPHAAWRNYLHPWDRDLYGPELRSLNGYDPLGAYGRAFHAARGDEWDKALLADQRYYLPADMLVKVDRTSMAHGLEVRVPFLDRRIMDLAATLDRRLLATLGGKTKHVLRAAAEQLGAPPSVVGEPKRGFNVPMNRILAGGLRPLADRLLASEPDILAPYCVPERVRRMWQDHRDGRADRRYVIWTLLTFAVWREQTGI